MNKPARAGLSLAELVGVLVMVCILFIALAPQFMRADQDTQLSRLRFDLEQLRERVRQYEDQHGEPPAQLRDVMEDGELLPENPFSLAGTAQKRRAVRAIETAVPRPSDVTPMDVGGWLYAPGTGRIWPDHPDHLGE